MTTLLVTNSLKGRYHRSIVDRRIVKDAPNSDLLKNSGAFDEEVDAELRAPVLW
ncbi:MAG: hypothetical protein F6K00_16390 [Leptolyngbya sp. SIOISBB]|nr:hypothetical protein [Leptolyngbya sp. SIOISBB]